MKSTVLFVFVLGLYTVLVSAQNYRCESLFAIGRHPSDCSKWFRCSYGIPYSMKDCSPGMLFSKLASTCVLKGSEWDDCHTDNRGLQQRCGYGSTSSFPKPDNCAQFYNCSLPVLGPRPGYLGDYVDECPYPKLFSQDTLQCEDFERVRCGQRKEIVYACDYKKLQCPVSHCRPCQYTFPNCKTLPDGLHPWAEMKGSSRYASCFRGRGFPQECPNQQVFSANTGTCEVRGSSWLGSKRR